MFSNGSLCLLAVRIARTGEQVLGLYRHHYTPRVARRSMSN